MIVCLLSWFLISCATRPDEHKIWKAAQDYVESNLANSSTITFPAYHEDYVVKIGKDKYKIEAYVIEHDTSCCEPFTRTLFSCIVEYKNGKYTAYSIEFGISENWAKPLH